MDDALLSCIWGCLKDITCYICYEPIENKYEFQKPTCCNGLFHYECIVMHRELNNHDCPYCGRHSFTLEVNPISKCPLIFPNVIPQIYQELINNNDHLVLCFDRTLRRDFGTETYCNTVSGLFTIKPLQELTLVADNQTISNRIEEFTYGIFGADFDWTNIVLCGMTLAALVTNNYYNIISTDAIHIVIFNKEERRVRERTAYVIRYIISRISGSGHSGGSGKISSTDHVIGLKNRTVILYLQGFVRQIHIDVIFTNHPYIALSQNPYSHITMTQIMFDGVSCMVTIKALMALKTHKCLSAKSVFKSDAEALERFKYHIVTDTVDDDINMSSIYYSYHDTTDHVKSKLHAIGIKVLNTYDEIFNKHTASGIIGNQYLEVAGSHQSIFNQFFIKNVLDKITYIDIVYHETDTTDLSLTLIKNGVVVQTYHDMMTERAIKKFVMKYAKT